MKSTNLNPSGDLPAAVWRGHIRWNRAAVPAIDITDDAGHEVDGVTDIALVGLQVIDTDDGSSPGTAQIVNEQGLAALTAITPAQLVANTNDWAPVDAVTLAGLDTASIIRASTDASRNLTGIAAPVAERTVILENVGAFDLVLKHNATSSADNRFYCPNDVDLTLVKDAGVFLEYDVTSAKWRVVETGASGGPVTTSGLTMSTNRLLGRTTASTGAIEEISIGTGLSLSAGSLDATGIVPGFATPAITYGTPAAGAASTVIRSDSTIAKPTAPDVDFSADVTNNNATSGHHGLLPKLSNDATTFLDGTGAFSTPTGAGEWTTVTKASNESVTSVTVRQDDNELFFATSAGVSYAFELFIVYASPLGGGTPDFTMTLGEDNTVRGGWQYIGLNASDAAITGVIGTALNSGGTFGTATSKRVIRIFGVHYANGSNFKLQWAQNTTDANPLTVYAGSIIRYKVVG